MKNRNSKIIRVSILGIAVNLALVVFKTIVGLLSHSIAIVLDAVNNFSDMLSSIATIVGARFASKGPDHNHPMGHGRSEYLSTVMIAMLIIYIGFTALIESVKKIIVPEAVDYNTATVIVVSVAIVAKILLGLYVRHRGKKLSSSALIGSGIDALYDAVISAATLIAIVVFFTTGISVEAYLAAGISLFILRSGIKLLLQAFSIILGERADPALTKRIKSDITKVDGVNGAFDLAMHDYGAGSIVASVNIEVDRHLTAADIDDLSRLIQKTIYKKHHVMISSVGVYAIDLSDKSVEQLWHICHDIRKKYTHIKEVHGFNVDKKEKEISFDIVLEFSTPDRHDYFEQFEHEIMAAIPDYDIRITLDPDLSD